MEKVIQICILNRWYCNTIKIISTWSDYTDTWRKEIFDENKL